MESSAKSIKNKNKENTPYFQFLRTKNRLIEDGSIGTRQRSLTDLSSRTASSNVPQIQDVINIDEIVQQAVMQSQSQCMSMFRQEIKDLIRTTVEETMTELGKKCVC